MTKQKLEKRLYTFPHFMLSPLAKGIQTTHSTVEMFVKYTPHNGNNNEVSVNDNEDEDAFTILYDWADNHKTEIMLNPGVSGDLENLLYLLQDPTNFYPWTEFHEDEYSLKGVMTAISIVLTEKIYNTAAIIRKAKGAFAQDINTGRYVCIDTEKTDFETLEIIESYGKFSSFEMELVTVLGQYRLAN